MKRIALIVTGTALLVASCGIASAASKIEVTMPNHLIVPYPAELETKGLMPAPNTAYQLLNPVSPEQLVAKAEARKRVARPQYTVSPEQLVAKAEARKHVARPQYTVSPEQLVAKAEARKHVARPQYTVSPEQLVARAEHVARPLKHATKPTSPVTRSQAPTGLGTAACSDTDYNPCFGDGPLSPSKPSTAQAAERSGGSVGSGSRAVVGQTNVPQ